MLDASRSSEAPMLMLKALIWQLCHSDNAQAKRVKEFSEWCPTQPTDPACRLFSMFFVNPGSQERQICSRQATRPDDRYEPKAIGWLFLFDQFSRAVAAEAGPARSIALQQVCA